MLKTASPAQPVIYFILGNECLHRDFQIFRRRKLHWSAFQFFYRLPDILRAIDQMETSFHVPTLQCPYGLIHMA